MLELRLCGGVEVEVDGRLLPESLIGGRQGRLVLAYLACERERAVRREELADLLWPEHLPETWAASLSAVISRLRRCFTEAGFDGQAVLASAPGAYQLHLPPQSRVDLDELVAAVAAAEDAAAAGDAPRALAQAAAADAIAGRGFLTDDCDWVDLRRAAIRDLRVRAAIAQSTAHLASGATARAIDAARHAVDLDDAKEAAYRQLMLALAAAGERGEALRVWERCRIALVEELGIDPSPETEAVYLQLLDAAPAAPVTNHLPSGVVTFLLTDIVESSALWEEHATAMAQALERHDTIVADVVAAHGGTLLKSKLEGDATVSVFVRATEGASAALALIDALISEPWPEHAAPRVRMAMHTGEAFERGGDYFGPALNRAARLRGLAAANEVLLSQAAAELVRDHLPADVTLRDRGLQNLRGLSRGENIFELVRVAGRVSATQPSIADDLNRPPVPAALTGIGPFVGRGDELAQLTALWERASAGDALAAFVGGEPGVGKSRLAGELAQYTYAAGGLVLYGRCDEDLAAPLQPFIEAARVLAPALGPARLRTVRGVDELTRVLPELTELLGEKPGVRADPDTERLALFDAVTNLLATASRDTPILLVLDDLHWAGKTTLSLLRHVLRGAKDSHLLVVGTYRDTELARTHPLAETLADLRRDINTHRVSLSGLAADDVAAYLAAIGNTDRALGQALAEVTAGNPFFLIEVVRHVEESGGVWQPGSLPEGVREATGRRLSRLSDAANDALAVAAVVGTSFDLALVEQVRGVELIDAIAEALHAGLVVEEPGSLARFRFAHAIVRQVLLSELVSLKRVRLHRTIAELLEASPAIAGDDTRLADLAYHWFECASTGSADKAVAACRTAADRAFERLGYEEAADLYGMALQALEWIEHPEQEIGAALHLARCDALLTAGDVTGARDAIDALELAAAGSERLAAWYTTYEGQLAVLGEPDRLTEIVQSIAAAAGAMSDLGDTRGEAKARYVHAVALERLGQFGAAEHALDAALAAARSAGDRRLADAILAEAPTAALWGPSPVTRASGRCLDVVRVLRITSGTPAVEAVALRCQAVLEAMRGRMPAARRMVSSSRRTVEELGLTHRLLEADIAAGLIELLDGKPDAAEPRLRDAYEGLRERGLDGDAARAGSFLARALLLQDRVDEADDVAAQAEALAGSDLEAAINWRDVRAEVASRRGDVDRALVLAREAVELASSTDSLLLVSDARQMLSLVLRAAGDIGAADTEARLAVEAADEKGATVIAAAARATLSTPEPTAESARPPSTSTRALVPNRASAAVRANCDAFNRGDWDAVAATVAPNRQFEDRRPLIGLSTFGDDDDLVVIAAAGNRFDDPALLATRGDRAECSKWVLRSDTIEVPYLAVTGVDTDGLIDHFVMFEPEAIDDAMASLEAMGRARELENDATRVARLLEDAFNAHDWDAFSALPMAPMEDRRAMMRVVSDVDASMVSHRLVFDGGGTLRHEIIATHGRTLALATWTISVPEPEAEDTVLVVMQVDDARGEYRTIMFDLDDVQGANAEFTRLALGTQDAPDGNLAWRVVQRLTDALVRRDLDAAFDLLDPGFEYVDTRNQLHHTGEDAHVGYRMLVALDDFSLQNSLVATRGENLALLRVITTFTDGSAGPAEYVGFTLYEVNARGLVTRVTLGLPDDVDAALELLDHRYAALTRGTGNAAWRAVERYTDALNRRDWDAVVLLFDPTFVYDDRRNRLQYSNDEALAPYRVAMGLDEYHMRSTLLGTLGDRLVLTQAVTRFRDRNAGPAEYVGYVLYEVNERELLTRVSFGIDDLDVAQQLLATRYAALTAELGNAAWRAAERHGDAMNRRDWDAMVAGHHPSFEIFDHHEALRGDDALATLRVMWSLDECHVEQALVATRGECLALVRTVTTLHDGETGPAELLTFVVHEVDDRGLLTRVFFNLSEEQGYAKLDTRFEQLAAVGRTAPGASPNAAWRVVQRQTDALNRRDWETFVGTLHPEFEVVDSHQTLSGADAIESFRVLLAVDEYSIGQTLLATRGDQLALIRGFTTLHDGVSGAAEISMFVLNEIDDTGRMRRVTFNVPEGRAYEVLEARYAELTDAPRANRAWENHLELVDAVKRHDQAAFDARLHPDFEFHDFRSGVLGRYDDEHAVDSLRAIFEMDVTAWDAELVTTIGERLALFRSTLRATSQAVGEAVWEAYTIDELAPDGRVIRVSGFNPDALELAQSVLHERAAELERDPQGS